MVPADIPREDAPTLAAIGVLAYVGCDVLHELLGHGGACLVTGGRAASLSAFHFQCFGGWQRLVCAAGILANLATAILAWLALRMARKGSPRAAVFLWLFLAYNAFTGFGNIVTSVLSNNGDVANAFYGSGWNWRPGMMAVGVGGYIAAIWLVHRARPRPSWQMVLIPYFSAAVVACAAAALNSIVGQLSALTSAVTTTLGCWGFLLLPPIASAPVPGAPVERSRAWIIAAIACAAVFIFLLGPGHRFR